MDSPSEYAQRTCGTKRPYEKARAKTVVKMMKAHGEKNIHAYRCPCCNRWHVGHDGWRASGA